jgi:hypothetical protein
MYVGHTYMEENNWQKCGGVVRNVVLDAACYLIFSILISLCRKQELRELKMLQKQEQKQFQDLSFKAQFAKDQQV